MVKNFTFRPMFRPSCKDLSPNQLFGNDISENLSKRRQVKKIGNRIVKKSRARIVLLSQGALRNKFNLVSNLAEIEAAAVALAPEEKQQLMLFLDTSILQ